jgi:hypothetical protein
MAAPWRLLAVLDAQNPAGLSSYFLAIGWQTRQFNGAWITVNPDGLPCMPGAAAHATGPDSAFALPRRL